MEIKELTAVLVVAMVGCILVAGFIPVVGESVSATTTFKNDGYYSMDKVNNTANIVITWDHTDPNVITIDDKTLDVSFATSGLAYTVVGGEDLAVRYVKSGTTTYFQGLGSTYFNGGANQDITITVANGEVVCKSNRSDIPDYTVTYTFDNSVYVANPNGTGNYSYVMKDSTKSAYINGDSIMTFVGVTNLENNKLVGIYGVGTLDDGMDISTIMAQGATVDSYSEPTPTYTAVNGYNDLYALDKYEFTITYDTTSTYDATYSYFIVPAEVTAEKTIHADGNTASIVSMIPFILIMGIVLMFVGVVLVRRYV